MSASLIIRRWESTKALKLMELLQRDLSESPAARGAEQEQPAPRPAEETIRLAAPVSPRREAAEGLSSAQARERLEMDGENTLKGGTSVHPVKIFTAQFKDLMVLILLVCTGVSVFMGEYTEAVAIAVIVFVNALLGFFQELKTEKTLEALKNMAAPQAAVYRDGSLCKIPASQLVTGDVIQVEAGDRVPADGVILDAVSLAAEEAVLTGESVPVEKTISIGKQAGNELNRADILYMGTTVTKGRAKARVIATGMKTQMGRIAGMLGEIEEEPTPLQKRLDQLGKYIAVGCLLVCLIVSVTGLLRGEHFFDMLITGVSLAVAAVPEGLPAIVTIALALAVGRMVKRKALIRKLHAVETLGCASVICSDKTGTLTQNKMTVKRLYTLIRRIDVTGDGYERAGGFDVEGRRFHAAQDPDVRRLLEIAVLCNNAQLKSEKEGFVSRDRAVNKAKGSHEVVGDPTEGALLVMAAKAGMLAGGLSTDYEKIGENPFDSERKCMSVVVRAKNGQRILLVKGACDVILNRCASVQKDGERHDRRNQKGNFAGKRPNGGTGSAGAGICLPQPPRGRAGKRGRPGVCGTHRDDRSAPERGQTGGAHLPPGWDQDRDDYWRPHGHRPGDCRGNRHLAQGGSRVHRSPAGPHGRRGIGPGGGGHHRVRPGVSQPQAANRAGV